MLVAKSRIALFSGPPRFRGGTRSLGVLLPQLVRRRLGRTVLDELSQNITNTFIYFHSHSKLR